jgi:hypothetical protein
MGIVLHYMLRLEPFTSLYLNFQVVILLIAITVSLKFEHIAIIFKTLFMNLSIHNFSCCISPQFKIRDLIILFTFMSV